MSNPQPSCRFPPGSPAGINTRFGNGQVNPGGKTRLQREFEKSLFGALCDNETAQAAIDALKAGIKKHEQWAVVLYFSKVLPPSFHVKIGREEADGDEPDFSKLSDEEFEQLNRLLEKACASGARVLEPGEDPPGPEGVR